MGVLAHFYPCGIFWSILVQRYLVIYGIVAQKIINCLISNYQLTNVSKKSDKKKNLNYVKMTIYSQRFLNYMKLLDIHKHFKCQNVLVLPYCTH